MAKTRVDAKTRDEDVPITSWGFGFLPQETEAQIQSRHAFYMFEFRVRKCALFRTHSCKHCKPFSCRYAHYENQTRRVPKLIGDVWNYDVQLCSANSLLECPQGLKCGLSHRLQKENIYHPLVYKTKVCEHSLVSCGPPLSGSPYASTQAADFFPPASQEWFQCSEFGIHCAKAHGPKDLRVVPGAEDNVSESTSSTASSSSPAGTNKSTSSSPVLEPIPSTVPRIPSSNSLHRVTSSSSLSRVSSSSSLARVASSSSLTRVSSSSSLANSSSSSSSSSAGSSSPSLSGRHTTRSPPLVLRPSMREDSTQEEDEEEKKDSGSDGGGKSEDHNNDSKISKNNNKHINNEQHHHEIVGRDSFHDKHNSNNKNFLVFHKSESARRNSITDSNNNNNRSLTSSASAPTLFSSRSRSGSSSSLAILDAPHLEHSHSPHFPPFHPEGGGGSRLKASSASFFAAPRASTSSPTVQGEVVMHTPPNLELEGTHIDHHNSSGDSNNNNNLHRSASSQSLRRVDSTHSLRKSDSTQSLRRVDSTQSLRRVDSAADLDPAAGNCIGWLNTHSGDPPQDSVAHSHQIYLDSFRVRMCVDFLSNKCNFNSRTCFHAHHQRNRRRRPVLSNGRFNYVSTRCPTLERERTCPSGASCHYAHTAEEVVYHPSKYKTHMCAFSLGRDQACSEYGMHCAKAHGPEDKRDPVLSEDEVSRNEEHAHFMFEYKTKACEGYAWDCNSRQYHTVKERRRLLVNIRYLPEPCPNVLVGQKWGAPNVHCRDESGNRIDPVACGEDEEWRCFLAHTSNEISYHPLVYKTVACEAFDRNQVCEGRFCPSSHGATDRRSQHTAREWKTQIISRAAFEASSHRLSRTGSYALLPRSGGSGSSSSSAGSGAPPSIPRNASYPSLKSSLSSAPAPFVSSIADQSYSPSPSPSFTSPRRIGTRFVDEEGTRKRSDSATMRGNPSQERASGSFADSGPVQPRPSSNPYTAAEHESTPGCFAPFSFGLGLSGAFENSLWVRPRGEDIWRPPDKALPEPFTVRPANVESESGGPWCSCTTFKTKLSCKHVAPVMSIPSPQSPSQSSSDSPRSSTFNFPSLAMPILSSCSQAPPSPSYSSSASSFTTLPFSPPPATHPQSIPVVEPGARCSCARFLEAGTCKHVSRLPTGSPPKSSSIVDTATAAAAQLSWRAEELMDHSHRKLSGYMGSLGASIEEADREWFRKPKNTALSSTTPTRTSNLATIHTNESLQFSRDSDLSNSKVSDFGAPPAYSPSIDTVSSSSSSANTVNTLASSNSHSGSSRDLKKTSELIAEAKMKGLGGGGGGLPPIRTSSPSIEPTSGNTSPSASSASLLRKSLSKLPALRLPDVKSLFPAWPPPRTMPLQQQPSNNTASPPSFFDSSEPVLEEELEPSGLATSDPPSPSQPQPQGAAWASTPLDFSNQHSSVSSAPAFESSPPSSSISSAASSPSLVTTSINPLSRGLECKFPLLFPLLSTSHILVNPVSLQCCGLCMCRSCAASAASMASPSLHCTCGTPITASVLEGALAAPSNQALMAILSMFAQQPSQR